MIQLSVMAPESWVGDLAAGTELGGARSGFDLESLQLAQDGVYSRFPVVEGFVP